ncbi:hypothetical protein B0H19DRAFT_1073242 [Mycena capillaripes]|nr:hypothetical protein B0H19DRAFT_1073242 [Mycena capillaripes]
MSTQKQKGYAVFYGREPGVYSQWHGPLGVEAQTKRVCGALHQGYASLSKAHAVFVYAQQRGWTGVCHSQLPSPSDPPPSAIPALPQPVGSAIITQNPLHGNSASAPHWHIVYARITPGIYVSYVHSTGGTHFNALPPFFDSNRPSLFVKRCHCFPGPTEESGVHRGFFGPVTCGDSGHGEDCQQRRLGITRSRTKTGVEKIGDEVLPREEEAEARPSQRDDESKAGSGPIPGSPGQGRVRGRVNRSQG